MSTVTSMLFSEIVQRIQSNFYQLLTPVGPTEALSSTEARNRRHMNYLPSLRSADFFCKPLLQRREPVREPPKYSQIPHLISTANVDLSIILNCLNFLTPKTTEKAPSHENATLSRASLSHSPTALRYPSRLIKDLASSKFPFDSDPTIQYCQSQNSHTINKLSLENKGGSF